MGKFATLGLIGFSQCMVPSVVDVVDILCHSSKPYKITTECLDLLAGAQGTIDLLPFGNFFHFELLR